jgi:hypothetical protein
MQSNQAGWRQVFAGRISRKRRSTMDMLPWRSIAFYSAFAVFVYYQRLHAEACEDNGWVKLLMTGQAFAGMLTSFIYLVYCGWKTNWWIPVIALGMSALAAIPAILIERLVGRPVLGQIAVPAWPLCAYLMFHTLPG